MRVTGGGAGLTVGNTIRGNSIHSNGGLGIDLDLTGVTPNDPGDGDVGPNTIQNFPLITDSFTGGGNVYVAGSLNSASSTTFDLDFYANTSANPSGHGGGETYLGSGVVTTNGTGDATFAVTLAATVADGHVATATATDPAGNTSEFSSVVTMEAANTFPGPDTTVAANPDGTPSEVSAAFDDVTEAGVTTVTTSTTGPPPPGGFALGNPPTYYDLTTTATFAGMVTVCIDYSGFQYGNESNLTLRHREVDPGTGQEQWVDRTVSLDTVNDIICATVDSFSLFIVTEQVVLNVAIDIKPGTVPNSINLESHGNIPVAIFSTTTFDATTVDPATVELEEALVRVIGNGNRFQSSSEDVNGDGLLDLVVHVETAALEVTDGDTEAVLTGMTFDGVSIRGTDSIQVVP